MELHGADQGTFSSGGRSCKAPSAWNDLTLAKTRPIPLKLVGTQTSLQLARAAQLRGRQIQLEPLQRTILRTEYGIHEQWNATGGGYQICCTPKPVPWSVGPFEYCVGIEILCFR